MSAEAEIALLRFILTQVADFLAAAVVKQFTNELSAGPGFARFQWKERQRLVRLIARRGRACLQRQPELG